jgi:translocator protein
MFSFLNRTDRLGLVFNMVIFTLLALICNGIIFAMGWSLSSDNAELQPSWAPPGWAIGMVWLVLLAGLGAARWFIVIQRRKGNASGAGWIAGLAVFCCFYPFWTLAFDSRFMGLIGNVLTLFLAGWVTLKVSHVSRRATAIVSAVLAWVVFATVLLVRLIQLNGWN